MSLFFTRHYIYGRILDKECSFLDACAMPWYKMGNLKDAGIQILLQILLSMISGCVFATTYPGWLLQDTPVAFTPNQWEGEVTARWLLVNSTVDLLNVRGDITRRSQLFTGNSGDLNGGRLTFDLGVLPSVMVFYRGQYHEIVTEFGKSHTFGGIHSDHGIDTWSHEVGLRWNFLQIPLKGMAFAIEGAYLRHTSRDFSFSFLTVNAGDTMVQFSKPKEIRLSGLSDDGWRVRIVGSKVLGDTSCLNLWLGFESFRASSAISTTINYEPIKRNFDRRFDINESQWHMGIGIIWQVAPRVPIELQYEYLRLSRSERATGAPNTSILARYTNPQGLTPENSNNILTGKIGYWLTPNLNINLEVKFMSNQFLGIIPHYNNTITSRFFHKPYGYMGIGVGYAF